MKLTTFHQALIVGATAMALLFGLRGVVLATRGGTTADGLAGAAALAGAVVLGLYLRGFRRKLAAKAADDA